MSYKGTDKWECGLLEERISVPSLKELKEEIKRHIEETSWVSLAETEIREVDYEITNVRFSIRRIKK